jgi:hypothetical protein
MSHNGIRLETDWLLSLSANCRSTGGLFIKMTSELHICLAVSVEVDSYRNRVIAYSPESENPRPMDLGLNQPSPVGFVGTPQSPGTWATETVAVPGAPGPLVGSQGYAPRRS